jgi:hypothetical protein
MSRDGRIEIDWGGDLRTFRLDIDRLIALQDACGAGPYEILTRLSSGRWLVQDIKETLRLGLMGGGVEGKKARDLADQAVQPGSILQHVQTAQAVLMASLVGDPNEPVGKNPPAEETDDSPLPASTEPEPS